MNRHDRTMSTRFPWVRSLVAWALLATLMVFVYVTSTIVIWWPR